MPDPIAPPAPPVAGAPPADGTTPPATPPAPPSAPAALERPEGVEEAAWDALGDPGKQALVRMKNERDEAKQKIKDSGTAGADLKVVQAELAALKAAAEGREAEHKAAVEEQRVKDEALAVANTRILKAEVRALAAGKLSDPTDALLYLNLSDFEVGADGEVDSSRIATAIDDLITKKPYLAAQGGQRFQGSADGGARNGAGTSIDAQIAEATKAGNHQLAIALKQQRSAALLAKKS